MLCPKNKKYVLQFFYVWVCLFCFSNIAMAKVNFSLNVEPQTAKNGNPVFEIWSDNLTKVGGIQSGGSISLSNNATYYFIIPDISGSTGCSLPTNENLKTIWWWGWISYIELQTGNSDIAKTIEYNCGTTLYYRDFDGDGYGNANDTVMAPQPGYVANADDCDDTDANEYPGQIWYLDADGDNYSNGTTTTACERPGSHNLQSELFGINDCDDSDASVHPGADEICDDGIDQDCDGSVDENCVNIYYLDADQDGYGDPNNTLTGLVVPDGYVANDDDCDDNNAKEFPGQTWYQDLDGDSYSEGTTLTACERPADHKVESELTSLTVDCNDADAGVNPGAVDICEDTIDQDCSGSDAVCIVDNDGDGYSVDVDCDDTDGSIHPGAIEIPDDGIDQDCNGVDDTSLSCIDLSDTPLDTQLAASAPNLMLGLDDSGSMDWEIMTNEEVGLFEVGSRDYEYVFDDPGDNLYTTGTNSHVLYDEGKQTYWKSQWHGYNVIYYNPDMEYAAWSSTLGDADPDNPRSHPYYAANYFDLSADYFSIDGISIKNAHYYVWSDSEATPYLVVVDGNSIDYYRLNDTDGNVATGELVAATSPPDDVKTDRDYTGERQNFANWYSFYRKRRSTSVAAIANVIPKLKGVNVGFRSINAHILQSVLPISVNGVDRTNDLLDKLFAYHPGTHTIGSTPIRKGLQKIGKYYHVNETITPSEPELSTSPLTTDASGECQQNFAIMFTDGSYNGQSPGLGNVDDDEPAPYGDSASNTLADVAMYYWQEDLAPNIDNNVPVNFYDNANWQHMVTYTVSFGVEGNLDPDDYDLNNISAENRVYPTWPSPINEDKERIDDLWHTAVNGRGLYLSAKTPQELIAAFEKAISDVLARIGSGASVSINGEELQEGLILYQSIYSTSRWTGDVVAYDVNGTTGAVIINAPRWSASEVLDGDLNSNATYWDTGRKIATYDNTLTLPAGIPFRFNSLSTTHKTTLTSSDMVEYFRGKHTLEEQNGGSFRSRILQDENGNYLRDTVLADVVHSAPLYYENVVYVGGNDGMLHALNSSNGEELFAYVPDFVFNNLDRLIDPNYSHIYFVDLTPYAKKTTSKDLLVGGLGKGGKGYYCLDITSAQTAITSETILAGRVMWEYPNSTTPADEVADMGYSFSKAFVVNTQVGWAVIFGNGYNSATNDTCLYVVDADDGSLIKKICTGVSGGCNGLATPLAIDADADGVLDYVYAGGLQGNLWKFDLTGSSSADWDVAYKSGSTPKSLFQAKDAYGNPQPITTKPDAMFHCDGGKSGYIITFGTGKYLGGADLTDTSDQTLYAVWDYGDDSDDSEYLGSFERGDANVLSNQPEAVSLLQQTTVFNGEVDNVTYRILSNNEITWKTEVDADTPETPNLSSTEANHAGWYFDLPDEKERIVRDLVIRGGKVVVISSIPQSSSPCVAGGESYLMEVDACTGGRLDDAQLDINDDGKVDKDDFITIPGSGDLPPSGIKYPTMIFPPMIIDNPVDDTELKYFSTSAGNIIIATEKDEGVGKYYWKEID